MIYTASLGAM